MIYYITKYESTDNHAGAKAPRDIDSLCDNRSWKRLIYPNYLKDSTKTISKAIRLFRIWLFWLKRWFVLRKGDIVIYQHPMRCGTKVAYKFINRLSDKKDVHFISLIHDLDSLRYNSNNGKMIFEDEVLMKQFDAVICHNSHMKDYLIKKGVSVNKIICLDLFDYLVKEDSICESNELSIVVAGNLKREKSSYIYKLAALCSNLVFYVYGSNYEGEEDCLSYQGSVDPDTLPCCLKGRYGLVWDGNSIDSCDGGYGEYLKYNNPHKLSLYIASGKPVICWKQAAIADFVRDNGIGLIVDSLDKVPDLLMNIDESDYLKMKDNVLMLRNRVISGSFFYSAVDEAIARVNG